MSETGTPHLSNQPMATANSSGHASQSGDWHTTNSQWQSASNFAPGRRSEPGQFGAFNRQSGVRGTASDTNIDGRSSSSSVDQRPHTSSSQSTCAVHTSMLPFLTLVVYYHNNNRAAEAGSSESGF